MFWIVEDCELAVDSVVISKSLAKGFKLLSIIKLCYFDLSVSLELNIHLLLLKSLIYVILVCYQEHLAYLCVFVCNCKEVLKAIVCRNIIRSLGITVDPVQFPRYSKSWLLVDNSD